MKKILVVGSNSFSGSHFVKHALTNGDLVLAVSRSEEISSPFKNYRANEMPDRFKFLQANLNTESHIVGQLVKDFEIEYVVNFAAQGMVAESWASPEDWYNTNLIGQTKLISSLIELPLKKYINVTTPEVYGHFGERKSETFQFSPSTPYAISRAAMDYHLKAHHEQFGFPVLFTRAANVYGEGQQLYRVVPNAILSSLLNEPFSLHGGGTSRRCFIHVDDVMSATYDLLEMGDAGETYHISTDELVSISELVEHIFDLANGDKSLIISTESRLGLDDTYLLDGSKIQSLLDWSPKVSLTTGLLRTMKWAKENLDILSGLQRRYEHTQ